MSYRDGSLRGLLVWVVCIGVVILMNPFAMASADSATAAHSTGGSVEISATITPVRILVINSNDRIVEILSNGPGNITPSIHKNSPEGPTAAMTGRIASQYAFIMHGVNQHKTGVVYERKDNFQPLQFFSPVVVSAMLTGLPTAR